PAKDSTPSAAVKRWPPPRLSCWSGPDTIRQLSLIGPPDDNEHRHRARGNEMTTTTSTFEDVISSEEQLREVLGVLTRRAATKQIDCIDHNYADFIARSPLVLIGSSDSEGRQDVSPKGDPA